MSAGVIAAALSTFVKLHLSIPGHAILKVVLPLSFGYAIAPRAYSGTFMGGSALASALVFRSFAIADAGLGIGAFTSLILFGPLLDLTTRLLPRRSVWFSLALTGLLTNSGAFLVRGSFKFFGKDHALQKLFSTWLSTAMFSYAISGLLAGLICGMIFFHYRPTSLEGE